VDDAADNPNGHAFAVSGPTGYLDNMDVTLISPKVAAPTGDALVQWWMRLDTEAGYDTVAVEWSSDGATWKTLATYSGNNPAALWWSRYAVPFSAPGGEAQ
jgi:hypothetical protein